MNRRWNGPHPVWPRVLDQGWQFWALLAAAGLLAVLFFGSFAFYHWAAAAAEHDAIYQNHLEER